MDTLLCISLTVWRGEYLVEKVTVCFWTELTPSLMPKSSHLVENMLKRGESWDDWFPEQTTSSRGKRWSSVMTSHSEWHTYISRRSFMAAPSIRPCSHTLNCKMRASGFSPDVSCGKSRTVTNLWKSSTESSSSLRIGHSSVVSSDDVVGSMMETAMQAMPRWPPPTVFPYFSKTDGTLLYRKTLLLEVNWPSE